ncbi:MAG: beta-lactamase family protein [Proteobacteria bacterium]|nr:beta-lactamase family protein [Pseudomonadota bacterium]
MASRRDKDITVRLPALLFGLFAAASCRADVAYDFTPVTQQIDALLQRENLGGASLMVIRNGSVIDEEYFGTYKTATRIPIASASKWLSALAIERLVERGTMSWSDTIGKYIADAPADKSNITLGELFSHTAGFPNADAACLGDQTYTLASCAQQILGMTLLYPPGTGFIYTGNGMQVGGYMATLATGKSWDTIFQDEVTTPLGMSHTDFATSSLQPPYIGVPNPYVAGGVRSTLRDYANVVQMAVQQGLWNGTQYLAANSLAEMQLDQTHGARIYYTPDPVPYYGYGYGEWRDSVDSLGNAVQVSSTGKFGTSPWIDHDTGIAAVFLVFSQTDRIPCDVHRLWMNVGNVVGADTIFADSFDCVATAND